VSASTVDVTERRSEYAGVKTRELVLAGSGPSYILLHGFGDSADTWRRFMAELALVGVAAVAVDLPGFGSAQPLRRGPKLVQLDTFVAEVVRRHSAGGPPVLIGNSMGAGLTVRAGAAGLGLKAAIPVAVPGYGYTPLVHTFIWSETASRPTRVLQAVIRWTPVPARLRARSMRRGLPRLVFHDLQMNDPEAVDRLTGQLSSSSDLRRMLRLIRRMFAEQASQGYATERITTPMVIVHGSRDALIPADASAVLHEAVPASRLEIFAGCGHCPQLETPARLAELAVAYVNGL
jgi:pimeloyl-ACP methyl ester carboxylesterase